MGLVWRVLATIAGTNFVVMFVFVSLATIQFESVLSGLIKERLEVLAARARDPFISVIDLGLPVSSVRNGRAALEAAKQSDPAIHEIVVFGSNGQVLHTTSSTSPKSVPLSWIDAPREGEAKDLFHLSEPSRFIVGADLQSEGEAVAGLAIIYSKAQASDQVRAMAAKLAFVAGTVMAATVLLGALAIRFALSEHIRVFVAILDTYDRFARAFWRGEDYHAEKPELVSGLGVDTDQFWDLLQESEMSYEHQRAAETQPKSGADQ